jgi:hypothetical protein
MQQIFFRIYNRYGQPVFKTADWNEKWEGKAGGLEQAPGAYIWMLEYNDAAHRRISLKGTTLLIR